MCSLLIEAAFLVVKTWASQVVAHGFNNCGSQALEHRFNKPMSPALAGGFLSTGSPGKSSFSLFLLFSLSSNQELKARRVNFEAGVRCTVPEEREVCGDHLLPPSSGSNYGTLFSPPSSHWPL